MNALIAEPRVATPPAPKPSRLAALISRGAPAAPRSTILVVDDEPSGRSLLQSLLQQESYQVVVAANGSEAMERALEHRPDVVLLDVMMPDVSGYMVCQLMRHHALLQHIPILLLTALDDRASKLRGLEAGADDFLTKPFDPTELKARLRTITRLNRFRRLFEEKARYERLVELAPDGIVIVDRQLQIVESNAAFRRLVGRDLAGWSFPSLLADERAAALGLHLAAAGAAGAPTPFETALLTDGPEGRLVEISVGRVDLGGEAQWQFVVRDVTEKKTLETQLLRSQRIELLGQLAGGIVHDVNNLLGAVGGMTDLLAMSAEAGQQPKLTMMRTTIQRISGLLRQLLMFARGSDGEPAPVDPRHILEEVAGVVRSTFGAEFDVTLEAAADLGELVADGNQLHQVLMNLCVNARDAMPQGGRLALQARRARVSTEDVPRLGRTAIAGEFMVLSVSDSGTGIPPEVRAKLFDPFFSTKAPGKGTGLGLATVLRVVKRHQGFVILDTEVGRGTTFDCYFPLSTPPAPPSAT